LSAISFHCQPSAHHYGLSFLPLGREPIDECDVLQPIAVIALEQVVKNDYARLFFGVAPKELGVFGAACGLRWRPARSA